MRALRTRHKVRIARYLAKGVLGARRVVGKGQIAEVSRMSINWRLDLLEGIDFSIYLLGSFEPLTVRAYRGIVRPGDTVLDIGANVGAHTLPLAQLVGETGRVIAFEPSDYAFDKLSQNVALNRDLSLRIDLNQAILVAPGTEAVGESIYASWPLVEKEGLHEKHRGQKMPMSNANEITLDQYSKDVGLSRIDFVKLDVDGNEISVLLGAEQMFREHRPRMILEFAPHEFQGRAESFDDLVRILMTHGYRLSNANNGKALPKSSEKIRRLIPDGASMNVIAD